MESCRNNADNIRYGTTARCITWSARYETAYIVEKQITVPFFFSPVWAAKALFSSLHVYKLNDKIHTCMQCFPELAHCWQEVHKPYRRRGAGGTWRTFFLD